eukprot:jgi/Phyca11/114819/e_gw1.27.360.1
MEEAATRQHTHANTVYHCRYAYYKLHYSKKHLAYIFNKSERAIRTWIKVYETTGVFQRVNTVTRRQYTQQQRQWLFNYYQEHPLAYLDEVQDAFKRAHSVDISKTSVWRILHAYGLTWKVLERRAMYIKERDVFRFVEGLSYRKPRVSILAFIGVNGVLDYFSTESTFDRVEFTKCCQDFVHCYIWIVDGATIHRHPEVVHYLRSVGVRSFQRHYLESSGRDLMLFVVQTFRRFRRYNLSKVFQHCGWNIQCYFDPVGPLSIEKRTQPELNPMTARDDELDFTTLDEES